MYVSRYTFFFPISDTEDIILVNPLSGAVDIVDAEVINVIKNLRKGKLTGTTEILHELAKRRYIYGKKEDEERLITEAFEQWSKNLALEPESFFIYPTYGCNLRCTYCFQTEDMRKGDVIKPRLVDRAFEVMEKIHAEGGSKGQPLLTLFGGEPLMYRKEQKDAVTYILKKCQDSGFHSKIITNGVDLNHYIDTIQKYVDKHIQVTLDGPRDIHNKRRIFADGSGSFDKIADNVDKVLKEVGMHIALRINVDKENLHSLPEMASFIIERGWRDTGLITPYIAAVRDSGCIGQENVIPLPQLLKTILKMYTNNPETKIITLMGWRWMESIENLIKKGWLYSPLFNFCGAGMKRLCFDTFGDIYACAGFAGEKSQIIGRYSPDLEFYTELLDQWKTRNILTLPKCSTCSYNLLCGGGCTFIAVTKYGSLQASPCVGIHQILNLGFHYYYPLIKKKAEGG
ncbi:MAG: radical SAM protein [Theionarchaea archaeon]|nr:radical SAM protein [Theionarchaea archaeon]MBU7000656.1 radical SAM protein [Theionarchaea archaeon]MBU7021018.1 radical SAM protein [Theionarchaea archaeon]MBU7035698.1 radical SAM protein [Theionarchaea archaeon]MBU7040896.1 radical SAM protein [Theionarchaea archaeon]